MIENHRWNTTEFEKRTRELYRVDLHKLYPSEAWALYRILPQCKTVLDLGCGNGAMGKIVQQIAPNAKYTGVDQQQNLMRQAQEAFPFATYQSSDLMSYLESCPESDCVMTWAVLQSFGNWREVLAKMVLKAKKYVIADFRIANVEKEIWDENICYAEYGDRRGATALPNYTSLKQALLEHSDRLERVEILCYKSEMGKFTHLVGIKPEQFISVFVLKMKDTLYSENTGPCELYEQVPASLHK